MAQHNWTYDNDIVAFYLCRYGLDSLLFDLKTICSKLGMKPGSMRMRVQNFRFLEFGEGLDHTAQLSKRVFTDYKETTQPDHYNKVKEILYR